MIGLRYSEFVPGDEIGPVFDRLLKVFQELLVYTSGDVSEALAWLTELDKEYNLTTPDYGMADFIQDLIDKAISNSRMLIIQTLFLPLKWKSHCGRKP